MNMGAVQAQIMRSSLLELFLIQVFTVQTESKLGRSSRFIVPCGKYYIYIYPLSSLELPPVIPTHFRKTWASPAILRLFFAGLMAPDLVHVLQQIRKTCAAGDISNV